ncbi:MAG: 30S ribosomal protein S2 [Anaplasmataceae bacterium]|nr:30S ribosomal protein S2 [Anaplasmataceae bacterium]
MNTSTEQAYDPKLEPQIKEMIEAGVFYGCHKSKTNPKIKDYVFSNRGGIELIDAIKTIESLEKGLDFIKKIRSEGGSILIVATQPSAKASAKILAEEFGYPVVTRRWLGGLITNYKEVGGRRNYFLKLRDDFESGAFGKYTKKERLEIERQIEKMKELFGGIEKMNGLPKALLVIDPVFHKIAIHEARHAGIPIIALGDTTSDPDSVDRLVIGNTKSRSSVQWFMNKVAEVIRTTTPQIKEEKPVSTGATPESAG